MNVFITGMDGQLGRSLVRTLSGKHEVIGFGRSGLDVTDAKMCHNVLQSIRPDVVVHAAAYTAVDQAETEKDAAFAVNACGAANIAAAAQEIGAKMCYISTDYVFDGNANVPYQEFDATNPINVYGWSKRAGEEIVRTLNTRYYIVRTSWLYGLEGRNFAKTMVALGKKGEPLNVVDDQVGSPTFADDVSRFIGELIESPCFGIYHATNGGQCSWYDFAAAIFEEMGMDVPLRRCTSEQFPRPARRPAYSVLDNMAIRLNGFRPLRPWREALREWVSLMQEHQNDEDR